MPDIIANQQVTMPYIPFITPRSFKAIANGNIYVGVPDTDPTNPANRVAVYFRNENGSLVQISQPVKINSSGYPVYNGQVGTIVTESDYSMAVYDAYGAQQYYFENCSLVDPFSFVQRLSSSTGSSLIGGIEITADSFGVIPGVVSQVVALQNARLIMQKAQELSAAGGGTIVFPRPLYMVHQDPTEFSSANATLNVAALRIPFDNIILRGQGWNSTTIRAYNTDAAYGVIQWSKPPLENGTTKVRGVGLQDICIDGNYLWNGTPYARQTEGIVGAGIEGLTIRGLKVKNCSHYALGLQNGGYKGCSIDGFWSENTGADGIDIKDNGSVSRAFQLNNIFVFNFGQLDEPAHPWAGVDVMSLAPKVSNVYVSDFGNVGAPGAGVRIKQGIIGDTVSRGTGGVWSDVTNITVIQNRFKSTDSDIIGLHIKSPFVNYSNISCLGYDGGRIGASVWIEERYCNGSNIQCANAITGYQTTTASGASDRQFGDAEACSVTNIVCRDTNVALRLNRKYQKLTNVTLRNCPVGIESGGSNTGKIIINGLHLESVTDPFNQMGGVFHCITNVTGPQSDDYQVGLGEIRDSSGFARTAVISKNAVGLYVSSTEASAGTEVARFASAVVNINTNMSVNGNIQPSAANTRTVGTSSSPFAGGFTQAAYTVTSDERQKSRPVMLARGSLEPVQTTDSRLMEAPYADDILDAWAEVDFVQFQFIDQIEVKGDDGARWHFGIIAQRAKEAFERHGLDPHKFAFFCYDEWQSTPEILDEETGEVVVAAIEAGSRYGIRYEQALVIEAALQRRNADRQKALTDKLSDLIKELTIRLETLES